MAQIDDMKAIDHYMNTANATTPAALKKQLEWKAWYPGLGWLETATDANIYAKAKRIRDDFNSLNKGVTPKGQTPQANQKLTIKAGSTGPNVVEWQRIIGVPADGKFGPNTTAKTIEWQRKNGLTADGIVGPATWTKALSAGIFTQVANAVTEAKKVPAAKTVPAASLPTPKSSVKSSGSGVLKEGSTGTAVANWQNTIGAKADGVFGPKTTEATKEWQTKQGLKPDGVVGPQTLAAATVATKTTPTAASVATDVKKAATQAVNVATNAISAAPAQAVAAVKSIPIWMQVTGAVLGLGAIWSFFKGRRA